MIAYHVTSVSSLPSIFAYGLIPIIGNRSKACGEKKPSIFLFPDRLSAETAVINWLGDAFADAEPLALLAVLVEENLCSNAFELQCYHTIPPEKITVISTNY